MDFSFDNVVSAITVASSSDPNQDQSEKQGALDFLEHWTHSEDGSNVALQILSDESLSNNHKIYATSLIKKQIPIFWGKISEEDQTNIRDQFFNVFETTKSEITDLLFQLIVDILVAIALIEFPQKWPDIGKIVFSEIAQTEDPLIKSHYYYFVAQLISSIDNPSSELLPDRHQYLRNLFLENCDVLYNDIVSSFESGELVKEALKIFNAFLQWASFEQVNSSMDLFRDLCFNFIINPETRKETLECLTTVFCTRLDSSSFISISPLIIFSLCTSTTVCQNQMHITSDSDVLNFLLRLLARFLPHLLTVFDGSNESSRTESIRASMMEFKLDPNEFKDALIFVLGVIVSIDNNDQLTEEYWSFWITIFSNMLSEMKKGAEASKPINEFMRPLLPEIRESIYKNVPLDHLDDNEEKGNGYNDTSGAYVPRQSVFCTNRSRTSWSLLAQIDPEGTLTFMKEQSASIAQCYAIGNLEFCNREQFDVSLLNSELTELYNLTDSKDPDPELFIALLFCFSHTLTFDNGGQSFVSFIEFATKCVNEENPPISTAATNALLYATRRVKGGFLTDNYVSTICENCDTYLMRLEHDDAVRMYRIASTLACTMSTKEQITELFAKMTEPIKQAIEAEFQLEKIFDCIKEASNQADTAYSRIFMGFIWDTLMAITDKIIHTNPPDIILESCLDAVSTGIRNEEYNEERIYLILGWMVEKTQENVEIGHLVNDSFYKFIGYVRVKFNELNKRLPDIISMFVEPVAERELASLSSIMWMLSEFTFQLSDFEWYVELAIASIKSPDKQDNIDGLHCTRLLISRTNQESFSNAIKSGILPKILTAIFGSLTDMLHKESIKYLVEFIKLVMIHGSKFNLLKTNDFGQMLANAIIENNIQELQTDMFNEFITALINNVDNSFTFSKIISEFLILIRKISPNDVDVFKIEKYKTDLNGRGKIIKIKPDGETQEIRLPEQKHFRIIRKQNGFD